MEYEEVPLVNEDGVGFGVEYQIKAKTAEEYKEVLNWIVEHVIGLAYYLRSRSVWEQVRWKWVR